MKKLATILFFSALVGVGNQTANAQTQSKGEVKDQEFVIRKDRVLTVPVQPRIYEKLPVMPQAKGITDFNYLANRYNLNLKPLQLAATPAQKNYAPPKLNLFPGFVRAGYGNFASPLLEIRFMETEVRDFNYALQLNHQSFGKGPVLDEQSKESHSNLGFDGSYFLDLFEVYGGLKWKQDTYQFYGVDLDPLDNRADPIDLTFLGNVLNTIDLKAGIREIEKVGPFYYEAELSFRNFKDSYLVRESQFGFQAKGIVKPVDDWTGEVGLSYFATNPEDLDFSESRNYFAIRPNVSYNYGEFSFTAGLNIISENDSIADKSSDFRIFPVLKASYQFAPEFGFYGAFTGDVNRNTYYSFVMENPFLGPTNRLLNTVNNYKIQGGIEGQFQETFQYRAGIDVSRYNQLYFFVNNYTQDLLSSDEARFNLVYDDKVAVFNINAELGFKLSDVYSLSSRLDLYQYDLNQQPEAWHRPTWEFKVNNQVTPVDRLLIQANVNFMGGIKARGARIESDALIGTRQFEVIKLKTIADLQLKVDYGITERISIFAEGNNLLNATNTRWLNYPVRGIQLIGGASFKF
jgi:hypothetical protein